MPESWGKNKMKIKVHYTLSETGSKHFLFWEPLLPCHHWPHSKPRQAVLHTPGGPSSPLRAGPPPHSTWFLLPTPRGPSSPLHMGPPPHSLLTLLPTPAGPPPNSLLTVHLEAALSWHLDGHQLTSHLGFQCSASLLFGFMHLNQNCEKSTWHPLGCCPPLMCCGGEDKRQALVCWSWPNFPHYQQPFSPERGLDFSVCLQM